MYPSLCLINEGASLKARQASEPSSLPLWNQGVQLRPDDDDDDDLNIDTSNMTQEEKNELKSQRKLRKMNREKLKRSRVNDQFDHLCRVLNASKTTRVEKLTILNETLRTLYALKAENKMLKEHTRRMSELRVRIQNGESVGTALNTPVAQEPAAVPLPRTGTKDGHAMLNIPMTLEPVSEIHVKEEANKEFFGKCEYGFPAKVEEEGWAMFEQPQPNDLDFAFGDSGYMWAPQQAGAGFPMVSECELSSLVIPTDNSMDLFLSTSDECELLC